MLNKKLLVAFLTFGILASVAAAGTFAYFSSGVSGNANINTGVLKLTADGKEGYLGTYTVSNVVPGDSASSAVFGTLKNDGTVPGKLSMYVVRKGTLPATNLKVILAQQDVSTGLAKTPLTTLAVGQTFAVPASFTYTDTTSPLQTSEMGQNAAFEVYFYLESIPGTPGNPVITKTTT